MDVSASPTSANVDRVHGLANGFAGKGVDLCMSHTRICMVHDKLRRRFICMLGYASTLQEAETMKAENERRFCWISCFAL